MAHLNHTPEDVGAPGNRPNLRCWCQRCHNAYDAPHRAETRRKRVDARRSADQLDLFLPA